MASIKEISLPHGTIPTQMFGNVNLQNAVMYVNENFAAVKEGVNDAVAATNDAIAEKADGDHDHDDAYSALEHTHSQSEVIGLSSALDGKADLNHEHSQYLSSLPAHYHDVTGIQGLGEQLQAKAEKTHSHTMAQVENLSTELGVKASTAYVDQQVNAVGTSIKTIADQEIIDCGAAKEGSGGAASTDVPKDITIAPSDESVAQKNARVGSANRWARADHKHVFQTETDAQQISKLKHDGNGTDGAASFGTETIVPRIDHSHPLNFPSDKETATSSMSQDGMGEGGTALFGDTNYYADLGHSHPLNVASTGTPSDVVKSTGTASNGTSEYYARQNHVHKMPALDSDDIVYSGTVTVGDQIDTNVEELNDHESRIAALEAEGPGSGTVKSVDGKGPDTSGNVSLGALTTSNYSETLDDVYQAKSEKLDALDERLYNDGSVPSGMVFEDDCSTNCLAKFTSGVLSHTHNGLANAVTFSGDWPTLQKIADCFTVIGSGANAALKVLISKITGSSTDANKVVTTDGNGDLALNSAGNGLQVENGTLKVKCATNGGITADSNGIALGGLSENKWAVTDGSGKITTTDDVPITASPGTSGVVYNNVGNITYKTINGANGVAGTDANSKIAIAQIPTGTSSSSVALGNHTHAYGSDSLTGLGNAAEKNVGLTVNDVAAGSHIHGNITADGKLNGCSSADCFLVTTTNAVITHSNLAPKVSEVKDLVTQWINADKKLGAVSSVCGKTGAVTLDNSDVGAAATNHTHNTSDISDFSSSVQSLINSALASYATQSWVTSQLSDKASQSSVDTLTDSLESLTAIVQQISSDYVTSTELASYATREWVQSQGYVTDEELGEYLTTDDISQASINALASGVSSSTLTVVGEVTWNGSTLQYKYKEVTITKGIITSVPASYSTKTIDTPTVITWS